MMTARSSIPEFNLQPLLRPSDRVIVSVPSRIRAEDFSWTKAEASIVVNRTGDVEDAAVFVIIPPSSSSDIRITHLIPITATFFKHYLNQTPPSPSTSFFHQSSRPHITLALQNGNIKVELRISATLTLLVQNMVTELRRLVEMSRTSGRSSRCSHTWTNFYPVQSPSFNNLDDDDGDESLLASSSALVSPALSTSSTVSQMTFRQPSLSSLHLSLPSTNILEDDHPNPHLSTFSQIAFLRRRLFNRQERWSSRTPLRIRMATYNVNDKLPPQGTTELASLVGKGQEDLLVFGFEEVDLRSQAMLLSQGTGRAQEWEEAILRGLGGKAEAYEKLAMSQYVGVMIMVFVRKSLREAVNRVETCERGIGLLGFGGNKAGASVRLTIHDTTFCFVNSHLAAFAQALDRRRSDYKTLLHGLTFPRPAGDSVNPVFDELLPEHPDKLLGIRDSHLLFWMGDLNYRVEVADDVLRAWCDEEKWNLALEKDQLKADIASGKSFSGFNEHPIDFPPTFKYVPASKTLDQKRSPAYTDRILWSHPSSSTSSSFMSPSPLTPGPSTDLAMISPSRHNVTCNEYTSHEVMWSDHRPVSASVTTEVRVVDVEKRAEVLSEVRRELDKLEEEWRASVVAVCESLDFGAIRYRRPNVQSLKIQNPGRVSASWSFRSPGQDKPICKDFFYPFPCAGVLEPGQESHIRVVGFVDERWAPRLTLGEDPNDVLVLQVVGGKDTFITLQSSFQPTILGLPLHILSTLSVPIRELSLADRKALRGKTIESAQEQNVQVKVQGQKAVKEVWRLLEDLLERGVGVRSVWVGEGGGEEVEGVLGVIERLDTNTSLTEFEPRIIAQTLLHILISLPTPLIPTSVQRECTAAQDRDGAFAILEDVPQVNTNVLIGLMSVVKLTCASSASLDLHKTNGGGGRGGAMGLEDDLEKDGGKGWEADLQLVDSLVPALFGINSSLDREGERRFIRLLLES